MRPPSRRLRPSTLARSPRLEVLVVAMALLGVLALPGTATANKTCANYDHHHYCGSVHVFEHHWVYATGHEGDGEWTYWRESYSDFGWVYRNRYYGYLYCS